MNRDELVTEVLTTTAANTKPAKLVLTKAEIIAALAPLENIAERIKANEAAYLAWSKTLPTKDDDDYYEEPIVGFPDADLELYDRICGFVSIYGHGPLYNLICEIENSDELSKRVAWQRWKRRKKRCYERAAATRKHKAKAKADLLAANGERIAELEEQ
jgi:hypothetical protein